MFWTGQMSTLCKFATGQAYLHLTHYRWLDFFLLKMNYGASLNATLSIKKKELVTLSDEETLCCRSFMCFPQKNIHRTLIRLQNVRRLSKTYWCLLHFIIVNRSMTFSKQLADYKALLFFIILYFTFHPTYGFKTCTDELHPIILNWKSSYWVSWRMEGENRGMNDGGMAGWLAVLMSERQREESNNASKYIHSSY